MVREATLQMDENRVAELFTQIHDRRLPRFYNEENALHYVILVAYDFSPDSPYVTFVPAGRPASAVRRKNILRAVSSKGSSKRKILRCCSLV